MSRTSLKTLIIIALSMVIIVSASQGKLQAAETKKYSYKPVEGYVSDGETAIAIAVAVWTPIYGREQIVDNKPYKAVLKNGIWHVKGSIPHGMLGGVPEAEISKEDGLILRVSHGK